MCGHFSTLNLFSRLLLILVVAKSEVHYYITPSQNVICPQDPCLTLSQFAASNLTDEMNISLFFLAGNHSLDREIFLLQLHSIVMTKAEQMNHGNTFIECSSWSGKIIISETTFASITSLYFIGCEGNTMSQVDVLRVGDATFINSMISLNNVTYVKIANSSFLSNASTKYDAYVTALIEAKTSSFTVTHCVFANISFSVGTVIHASESTFTFVNNIVSNIYVITDGGVIVTSRSFFSISNSTFTDNFAPCGAVIYSYGSFCNISNSTFTGNAGYYGGAIHIIQSNFTINNRSTFTDNLAYSGGVIFAVNSSISVIIASFFHNRAHENGGVIFAESDSFEILESSFINNAAVDGGAILSLTSSFSIIAGTFTNNTAASYSSNRTEGKGGVIAAVQSLLTTIGSVYDSNSAEAYAGVMFIDMSLIDIINCIFASNSADEVAVLSLWDGTLTSTITNSTFKDNIAIGSRYHSTVTVAVSSSSVYITNCIFEYNIGSLYAFSSNITFNGYAEFKNCTDGRSYQEQEVTPQPLIGGAIRSYQSSLTFIGVIRLLSNRASRGGALYAVDSMVTVFGQATVAYNTAVVGHGSGGGFYLKQSDLKVFGILHISHNHAILGGGIYASYCSSTVSVYQPGLVRFSENNAKIAGGGIYLDTNPTLNLLKQNESASILLIFHANHAAYGGAIFVADSTSSGCLQAEECFLRSKTLYSSWFQSNPMTLSLTMSNNTASKSGPNLYGGLLDRCIPSMFAEVSVIRPRISYFSGFTYLENISNITLDSVSSLPVRVCFCDSKRQPNCSYQPSAIKILKGEIFTLSLVAVDQVNHSINAYINSYLAFPGGGFGEGQQSQEVTSNCTDLTYNVFSPKDSEIVTLFPDGPCGNSMLSTQHVNVIFLTCTCPVGFEPSNSNPTTCECICDSVLSHYISECNSKTKSFIRVNTNSWIMYVSDTDPPGYVIHPNCPFDYCYPPTEKVSFSFPSGIDGQCAHNRTGILCGACHEKLSTSLGSSRCLPCNSYWPITLVTTLIGCVVIGILLVIVLLVLNITVAVGFISGIIFYANIIGANRSAFFPSAEPSFPSVLVAWLNLDIGFDFCFFDGIDAYTKTWFQLAFPAYLISLAIIIIKTCERSSKFACLFDPIRRNPVATLATLLLLSYSKLLSITIAALSYAELHYPDGSKVKVWLPDGNVQYLRGKHMALAVAAFLIILIGVPYTLFLFLWQWLSRLPNSKLFHWTRYARLTAIVNAYHAPYSNKHRYWTGLLLLVRVVLYITAALFQSSNPQTPLLVAGILTGCLFFLKSIIRMPLYKVQVIDMMETVTLLNILCFSVATLHNFKIDSRKQMAIAYTSMSLTLFIIVAGLFFHVFLLIKRLAVTQQVEMDRYAVVPLTPPRPRPVPTIVTHSVVRRPTPEPPSTPPSTSDSSKDTESNDSQNENIPLVGEVDTASPAHISEVDTAPLLNESCL